jgi:hypothetical protein
MKLATIHARVRDLAKEHFVDSIKDTHPQSNNSLSWNPK